LGKGDKERARNNARPFSRGFGRTGGSSSALKGLGSMDTLLRERVGEKGVPWSSFTLCDFFPAVGELGARVDVNSREGKTSDPPLSFPALCFSSTSRDSRVLSKSLTSQVTHTESNC